MTILPLNQQELREAVAMALGEYDNRQSYGAAPYYELADAAIKAYEGHMSKKQV